MIMIVVNVGVLSSSTHFATYLKHHLLRSTLHCRLMWMVAAAAEAAEGALPIINSMTVQYV